MSYKSILVCLNEIRRLDDIIAAATLLGQSFDAHVSGLFVIPAPPFYVSLGVKAIADAFESQHKYFAAHADTARQAFETAMDRHGISHDFACIESKNALVWDEVVEAGIAADLILLGASRRDIEKSVEDYYAEEVIMRSGRPVIILPYEGLRTLTIDTIVAGWNGKREAARAIFDALPLLKRAQKVHLVSISRSGEQQAGPPEARARIMRTLARHQVPLQADSIAADGSDAGRVLMKHAEKLGAGLTIMGAYGHARNREYVFGGATFEMLLHMNRPVLMAN